MHTVAAAISPSPGCRERRAASGKRKSAGTMQTYDLIVTAERTATQQRDA